AALAQPRAGDALLPGGECRAAAAACLVGGLVSLDRACCLRRRLSAAAGRPVPRRGRGARTGGRLTPQKMVTNSAATTTMIIVPTMVATSMLWVRCSDCWRWA